MVKTKKYTKVITQGTTEVLSVTAGSSGAAVVGSWRPEEDILIHKMWTLYTQAKASPSNNRRWDVISAVGFSVLTKDPREMSESELEQLIWIKQEGMMCNTASPEMTDRTRYENETFVDEEGFFVGKGDTIYFSVFAEADGSDLTLTPILFIQYSKVKERR